MPKLSLYRNKNSKGVSNQTNAAYVEKPDDYRNIFRKSINGYLNYAVNLVAVNLVLAGAIDLVLTVPMV